MEHEAKAASTSPSAKLTCELARSAAPFVYLCQTNRVIRKTLYTPTQAGCYVLWHCIEGVVKLQRDDEQYKLHTDEMALVEPGFSLTASDIALVMRCGFDLVPREREFSSLKLPVACNWEPQPSWHELLGESIPVLIPEHHRQRTRDALLYIQSRHLSGLAGRMQSSAMLSMWLSEYVTHCNPHFTNSPQAKKPKESKLLRQAHVLMQQQMGSLRSIKEIARQLDTSPRSLTYACKKTYGYGPGELLAKLRLSRAKELLSTKHLTVQHAAKQVGLSKPGLRALFIRYEGCAPRHWQQNQSTNHLGINLDE